jgi:hypothetical protein
MRVLAVHATPKTPDHRSSIHLNPANKGLLHRELHVPIGHKIPLAKLEQAKHSTNPAVRKRANFALNFRKV